MPYAIILAPRKVQRRYRAIGVIWCEFDLPTSRRREVLTSEFKSQAVMCWKVQGIILKRQTTKPIPGYDTLAS